MPSGMKLIGDKELERKLKTLGERVQRKVARQAINAAATPVVKAAKANANASKESGLLKKSLGKKVKTYTDTQTVVAIVGPRSDVVGEYQGKPRKPSRYAHLVENGHVDEQGRHVPARPFLRPAMDSTEGAAMGILKDKLGSGIEKEAVKA